MTKLLFISLLIANTFIFSQNIKHKELQISRAEIAPKIDANLNDDAWKQANTATDFVMFRPDNGKKEPHNIRSVVKVTYDDEAIYFGAYLYDDKPEDIPMEFQTRDNFGNADFFGISLNPKNDGINELEFFVMSSGNQNDAQATTDGEDFSWNAVWKSAVKVVSDGWIVEIKIPYSALRFSNDNVQEWGVNFHRQHRNTREQYSWNFIDVNKGQIAQYAGVLTGISNISPPIRLSLNPYIFGASANFDGTTEYIWNAGMDIKYGLSKNFTLDATLIPDFGQAAFDNINLNLGPFEARYSEKRAFFTEGVDLFNKGNFFYSRRIGSTPVGITLIDEVDQEQSIAIKESIPNFPSKVDVLNIVKISGRTKKGLGIGVLNAITKKTTAKIKTTQTALDANNEPLLDENGDEITQVSYRNAIVEPLANYNVLVLDQQFNKNSSVSFVNTNVMREGDFRDANVTGLLFDLNTKKNTYGVSGDLGMSNVWEEHNVTGLQGRLDFDKISGKHRGGIGLDFRNKKYNQNDLGFQRKNNYINYDAYYNYRILKPQGVFNSFFINFFTEIDYLLSLDTNTPSYHKKSNLYTGNYSKVSFRATTKKQLSFGGGVETTLGNQYDYYEPRHVTEGRFYKDKPFLGYNIYVSSDYSKKFAADLSFFRGFKYDATRNYNRIRFSPRIRFNNKFSLNYNITYIIAANQKGYVNDYNGDIIFGNRDEKNITNSINVKYNFTTKSALNLSFRHNWNPVTYDSQFFKLNFDGTLSRSDYAQLENNDTNPDNDINHNVNFNSWNIDLNFKWEFAPGSELVALYRNQIGNYDRQSHLNFTDNLNNLFKQDQLNSISLKIVYYLDYNTIKHVF